MRTKLSPQSMSLITELRRSLELARREGVFGKMLLALSGGRDSMALFEALLWLQDEMRFEVIVAHFDHALRESSARDREFVREQAERRGVPSIIRVAEEKPVGENLEAWARAVRYDFLERVRVREGAALILTAHHRDDEAETFLFRTISGRLATRAAGVQRFNRERSILRPWLFVSRAEIDTFVAECRVPFQEDESNLSLDRTRNRLRHETIPELEQSYNPNLKLGLAEISERLTLDEELLWELAREEAQLLERNWSLERFQSRGAALRWRILGELARGAVKTLERDIGYRNLRTLEEQIRSEAGEGFELDIGNGIRAVYSRGSGPRFRVLGD